MTTILMSDKFYVDAVQLKQLSNISKDIEDKEMSEQMKEIIRMIVEQKLEKIE